MKRILLLIAAGVFALPSIAFAACSSPTGILGSMNWNGTAYVYCDGTTWSAFANATATSPTAFSFTSVTGQSLNAIATSGTVTIAGLGAVPVLASVSGAGSPQISVGGGAWATSAVIYNGQTIAVRMTTASTITTGRTVTVTVGTGSATFTATTQGVVPGSQNFTSSGSFTVPAYNTLTVTVYGAGSGGQGGGAQSWYGYGSSYYDGAGGGTGGNSTFNGTLIGYGGSFGAAGGGSGGDTNTTGAGAGGGGGGSPGCTPWGYGSMCGNAGGAGRAGGRAVKAYTPAMLTGGSSISVVVGGGGGGGGGGCASYGYGSICGSTGGSGSNGSVSISWN